MKGYKVFNPDWTCRGFQFAVGEKYHQDGEIELCENGFHFCNKLIDCFNYYEFNPENKVAEIKALKNIKGNENDKMVCSDIKIIKELTWNDVLNMVNTGKSNTGNRNTGNWNTGNWNTGKWNTGNWNTGKWNTGKWNTGFFNTETPKKINVFNQEIDRETWDESRKPNFLYFNTTEWVSEKDMTDKEKIENKDYKTNGGYLRKLEYKEAFMESWENASSEDKSLVWGLPNFDVEIFSEISGIPVEELKKYRKDK